MGASFSLDAYGDDYLENPNPNDHNNANNNNTSSDEEELEVRRKQRETERAKSSESEREQLKRHNSAVLIQKYWKGFSQRKKYSLFLTKIQVFKELLSTERDYIQFLEIIIRVYATPLRNLAIQAQSNKKESLGVSAVTVGKDDVPQPPLHNLDLNEPPLTLDEVKIVFSQIEVILLYNSQLFEKLRSRLLSNFYGANKKSTLTNNNGGTTTTTTTQDSKSKYTLSHIDELRESTGNTPTSSPNKSASSSLSLGDISAVEKKTPIGFYQQVGDIFLEMIDFLKVPYSHYIINFPACLKVLENASKRPAFMLFTQQCKTIPEVGKRDIQSFVSMPIQRIPRYVLLLRELLKFTVPGHSDHTNIELAVKRMEDIANLINRQMKEDETSKEVFLISQKLRPPIPNLVEPHRKIIKEGIVKVYKVDGNNHDNTANGGTIRPSSILSLTKGGTKYIFLFNDLFVITKKKKTHFQVEKVVNLEYSTIIDNYKKIKILQEQKEKEKKQQGSSKDESDDTDSDSNSNQKSRSGSISNSTPEKKSGERFYFKLHTLELSIVICLASEAEKELWKSNFITVINRLTENSLSFNPKWSKNDFIYGDDKSRKPGPRGSINPNNFTLTKSIAELLALSKPIKGMNFDKISDSTNNVNNNNNNNNNSTTSTTTSTSNNTDQTTTEQSKSTTTNDSNTTAPPSENRSRSASLSAGLSGTFERILQAIKS
ncbi:pleckstrin (PH) domain-containing protein [Tieghemostelium lacteum]|uniref:Pleckstrin (PH) domain-containing protein n=1 Tax=Tieghemostelium lacteum TaxID=361077 RepID=A0A152A5I4_TIELA|nr:pleckstrin (PH) domain-containing protein [Tieghemostelium lacteum]|eukprot:KYR01365.1 pleckstrin (PH) domain-containing protein [Tieghemostelium lacteum]